MEEVITSCPVRICPGCQKTTKKGNEFGEKELCGFCYFGESFLRKSGNQYIDDFLRKFAEWKGYPFLEFIPYEEFSSIKKIGHGDFSQVFKATWNKGRLRFWHKKDGKFGRFPPETVALKFFDKSQEMNSEFLKEQQFLNRINMPAKYKRRFIEVYGISQDPVSENYIFVTKPSNRPEIEEIVRIVEEWKSNYYLQFKEAEEERQKIIKDDAPFRKDCHPGSIHYKINKMLFDSPRVEKTPEYQSKVGSECQQESALTNSGQRNNISKWIPYEEFSDIEKIGQGRSSQVYKAIRYKNGNKMMAKEKKLVLKILNESRNLVSEFSKEPKLEFLFSKKYRRINGCYGISQDPKTLNHIIVMNYRPVDLNVYLQANFTKITWFNKREISNNIASGIMSIHRWNVIHRNLHSGNLLMAKGQPNPLVEIDLGFNNTTKELSYSGISFVKGFEQNHPKSVYYARLLNPIIEIANNIKNSRNSFNLSKPSASEETLEPLEIHVEPPRPKNVSKSHYQKGRCSNCHIYRRYADVGKKICRLCSFAELFPKSDNQDINNFLVRSSYNQARSILEWIPYEDFSDIGYIGIGGFSKVYKATWHRGHIKHWNLLTGEVVRSESVEVALKVLSDSADISSTFLNKLQSLYLFKSDEVKHRHIIKCYGVSQEPETKNYIFVMQYANYGSLRNLLATEFNYREIIEILDSEELLAAEKKREEMIKSGIPFVKSRKTSEHSSSNVSENSL
ncbi:13808_t:CDS:10 [Acaulospora morrowiae]|uniref:13808_t:CDS:1 n=1 Tax=Acaulospora morrowiae TaxID=94023 RepID=A0A9N8ZE71_9GLOM|nr:13808_t:CDS:10 [Acaulospora morrowiae]